MKAAIKRVERELAHYPEREQARPKVNCDKIASLVSVEADFIKEALDAGLYKQAVTMCGYLRTTGPCPCVKND